MKVIDYIILMLPIPELLIEIILAGNKSIRRDNTVSSFFILGKAKYTPKRIKYPVSVLGMKGKGC